ncbi:MAG TPA: hypothetical protein V6C58_05685 [Allocoleopsis sp.]
MKEQESKNTSRNSSIKSNKKPKVDVEQLSKSFHEFLAQEDSISPDIKIPKYKGKQIFFGDKDISIDEILKIKENSEKRRKSVISKVKEKFSKKK